MTEMTDTYLTNESILTGEFDTSQDNMLAVKFETRPVLNQLKSDEAGRPIYEDVVYITIAAPGNRDEVVRPVTELDIQRFAEGYKRFQERQEQPQEGTPLEEWPAITRSQVEELKFLRIHTVEQLVGMADSNAQNVMGIRTLQDKARAFLEKAEDNKANDKLVAELASRDSEIEALKRMLEEQGEQIKALQDDDVSDGGGRDKPSRRRSGSNADD